MTYYIKDVISGDRHVWSWCLSLLLSLLCGLRGEAQTVPAGSLYSEPADIVDGSPSRLTYSQYDAVDSSVVSFDHNQLAFPAGHALFDTLYQTLDAVEREMEDARVRVLHIGGSHVQADIFSGRMRRNLRAFSPSRHVGRGMMFPFSVMQTNGPKDYSYASTGKWQRSRNIEAAPQKPLGLAGAAISAMDLSAGLAFTSAQPFESLLLFGESSSFSKWTYPLLVADGDTIYPPRTMSEAGMEYLFPHPVSQCQIILAGDSTGGFTFRGMIADPYADGILYTSSGINGAAVPSWLRCEKFEEELETVSPDLVLLGIGINDANVQNFSPEQYKVNYRKLLDMMRRVNPRCAFIFMTNNDCYLNVGRRRKSFNRNTEKVEQALIELATEYQGAVWNLYRIMGGFGSSSKWVKAKLMKNDHVHFTAQGYELLGDLLYDALLRDYLSRTSVKK